MLNKFISLLLVALMTIPAVAFADTPEVPPQPKITSIAKDQPAPYSGVLLNTVAAAKIFTEKEFIDMECELRIEYAVQKEILRLNLLLETSQATVESMDKKYTSLLDIKDQEIKRLGKVASETNDWSSLWYVGGIITGVVLSVAIVYAVKEVN
jgi:hypothetical protein